MSVQQQPAKPTNFAYNVGQQQPAKPTNFAYNSVSMPANSNKVKIGDKISQAPTDSQVRPAKIQIIELSGDDDDDEEEKPSTI